MQKRDSKTVPLTIGIGIPESVAYLACTASRLLKKQGGLYTLNAQSYLPHITLYRGEFPKEQIGEIQNRVKDIITREKPFLLQSTVFRQNEFGYVGIQYKPTKRIRNFQKKIIKALNPLRKNLLTSQTRADLEEARGIRRTNFLQYGYDFVDSNFVPHLTFTKFAIYTEDILLHLHGLTAEQFAFTTDGVGIYSMGPENTCKRVIGWEQFKK